MTTSLKTILRDLGGRIRSRRRQFERDEDGAVFLFSLQLLIVMLIVTGVAIDFVRQEERRNVIQATLDRATLAAADLDQSLDPKAVVKDYMEKAGLGYVNVDPTVEEGQFGEYRKVTAEVTDTMPTIFGNIIGMNSLTSNQASQAEESIGNVEISLVLDVSGSMNSTDLNSVSGVSKISSLRSAAKNFVTEMFEKVQPPDAPEGRLTISVVPYNQQVTLGSTLGSIYHLSTDHTQNTCVDVQMLGFNNLTISPSATLQRTMYGASYDFVGQGYSVYKYLSAPLNCDERSSSSVLAFEDSESALLNKIQGLSAGGDTAIDIGARWGLALLDPSAQPVAAALASKGLISQSVSNRPLQYNDRDANLSDTALKVLVLMTDGQNTRSYSTKMDYRTGASGFYSTRNSAAFSDSSTDKDALYWFSQIRSNNGEKPYYSFKDGKWYNENEVGDYTQTCHKVYYNYWYYYWDCNTTFTQKALNPINWETIWGTNYTLQYVIQQFLLPPRRSIDNSASVSSIYEEMAIHSEFANKDANLLSVCSLAKDQGVKVFTIALSADDAGKRVLKSCGSGDSYNYEVGVDDLTDAFASISTAINSLRLTN